MSDEALPHPRWVEAIRFGLTMQGAAKSNAAWVARYFGMLGFDVVPIPDGLFAFADDRMTLAWQRGIIIASFDFRIPLDLQISIEDAGKPGSRQSSERLEPTQLLAAGRLTFNDIVFCRPKLISPNESTLAFWEFDEAGVNDYDRASRTAKGRTRWGV